jgi:hypothetical protein
MSVETTGVIINYVGDGHTPAFVYPNYLLDAADLQVFVTVSGISTIFQLNAQPGYTWTGIQDEWGAYPTGGTLIIVDQNGNPASPAIGAAILIGRFTPRIQPQSYIDDDPFPATSLEHGLDRLTCIVQELSQNQGNYLGELPGPPATGNVCDWFTVCPPVPGGPWGYVCTTAAVGSTPAIWNIIADISF